MQQKYRVINGDLKDDTGYHNRGDLVMMEEAEAAPLVAGARLEATIQDITPPAEDHQTQPDGFPARDTMTVLPPNAPSDQQNQQTPDMLAPQQNTVTQSAAPAPPQNEPANPTEEQVAKV